MKFLNRSSILAARAKLWLHEQTCALRPPGRRVAPARPFAGPSDHFKHGVSGVWAVGAPPGPKRYASVTRPAEMAHLGA